MVSSNADVNAQDEEGKTPLYYVRNENSVKLLIKANAEVNVRDNQGQSVLHYIVKRGYDYLVDILIKVGANVNVRDNEGKLPVNYASGDEIKNI